MSGHLLGKSCLLGLPYILFVKCISVISVSSNFSDILLSFTCNYVVSVRILLVLWTGCVILLWNSLCLQYNYFSSESGIMVLIALVPGHCLTYTCT